MIIENIIFKSNIDETINDDEYQNELGLPTCKHCHTPRYVDFRNEGGLVVRAMCNCQQTKYNQDMQKQLIEQRKQEFLNKQKKSMICEKYLNVSFENSKITKNNKDIFLKCKVYAEKANEVIANNIGLYIYGGNSSGKTHLTFCIANSLIEKGYNVIYTSMPTILAEIQKSFNNNGETQAEIIDKISRQDFVFIDDLGKEFIGREYNVNASKFAEKVLLEIINSRSNNGLPTIFTSNYSIAQLSKEFNLDKAIIERINEMATRVFKLEGDNFRNQILQNKIEIAKNLGI